MDTVLPRIKEQNAAPRAQLWSTIGSWLLTWEIYPLLLFASFLRLYQLSLTEFDADQAILARLPRQALVHGLIPGTGTISSIGMANPPDYSFLLLPIAAFTTNPLVDALFIALCNVLAVLLTYIFVRRYYGRLAATVAAFLFAVAYQPVYYSRFIWQPNLFPLFTLLFILALFWGAVERRSGWLIAALPLLGFLLQLHLLALYLAIPLVVALALAYKTVRWRDVALGLFLLLLLFSTYLIWETLVNFSDISLLLTILHQPSHIDNQALLFYLGLVGTPVVSPAPQAALSLFAPLLSLERRTLMALLLGGLLLAILGLAWKKVQVMAPHFAEERVAAASDISLPLWHRVWNRWNNFAASPQRSGLLLLLIWQIVPVLLMTKHSVSLQFHYLLFLLPGPFILIGLLVRQMVSWTGQLAAPSGRALRLAFPALALLLTIMQVFSTGAWVLDATDGKYHHTVMYTTLQDLQSTLREADRLAQLYHLRHVYIDADQYTHDAFNYLAPELQTPHTVFSGSHCLLLPGASQGPVAMIFGPADTLDAALLTHFARATLISKPSRLGGAPFQIYLVQPFTREPGSASFVDMLTADRGEPEAFTWSNPAQPASSPTSLLATFWTNIHQWPAAPDVEYTYHFAARSSDDGARKQTPAADCTFTTITPGEALLVPFHLPVIPASRPASLSISGSTRVTQPYVRSYGPFHFLSIWFQTSSQGAFRSASGDESIVLPGKL